MFCGVLKGNRGVLYVFERLRLWQGKERICNLFAGVLEGHHTFEGLFSRDPMFEDLRLWPFFWL